MILPNKKKGMLELKYFTERMVNFLLGPLEIPDFKVNSLGMNAKQHVHAIDIGYVHVGENTTENRLNVLIKTCFGFLLRRDHIGQI